jgi:GT2 family glycosyltransferase
MAMKGTARRPSAAQEWAAAGPIWLDSRAADRSVYAHAVPFWGRTSGGPALSVTVRGGVPDPIRLDPWTRQVDAGTWEYSATLVLDGWPRGGHELEIEVVTETETGGGRRSIVVDPEAAYEPHRARARTPAAREAADASMLISPVGAAAAGGTDLESALRSFLASDRDWLLLIEEDGELAPDAVALLAEAVERHGSPDAVYADDEWEATPEGATPVRLKPAFSPELLLASAYAGPLLLVGRAAAATALQAAAGPPSDVRELLLRLDPGLARIAHLPRSLFVRKEDAATGGPLDPGSAPVPDPCVSIVIPTTYRDDLALGCIESLAASADRTAIELILVDDDSPGREVALRRCQELGLTAQAIAYPKPFNFSVANNLGAGAANGSELLFLNDDIEAPPGPWLEPMRAWLNRPGVGIVGPKLLFPSGRIQHAGVTVGSRRIDNLGAGWPGDSAGPGGAFALTRDASAVTGACLLIDRGLFDSLGGFDPALVLEFGDVDLPLRVALAGARTVCTPDAQLIHHESVTRGGSGPWEPGDWDRFQSRWDPALEGADPYMHPGFDPHGDFEPAPAPSPNRSPREPLWARARDGGEVRAVTGADPGAAAGGEAGVLSGAAAESRLMVERQGSARDALESVLESRTWRYTRPLRRLGSLLRGR